MGISERKEREKSKKRELLIDAAEKVFFSRGYEQSTMDEIAEVAEYSKGTLYLYFKNKEELYIAISTRSMDIFMRIIQEEMGKAGSGKEKLAAIKSSYLRFFKEAPKYMKVMLHAFRSPEVVRSLHEDTVTLNKIMEKDRVLQEMIASAVIQSAKEGTLANGNGEISDSKAMSMVIAGGLILNGIFQNAFDMEDHWEADIPFKAEEVIQTAFELLNF